MTIALDFEKSISFQDQHLILKNDAQLSENDTQFSKMDYRFSKIETLNYEFFEIDPRLWSKSGVDFAKIEGRFPKTESRFSKIDYRLSLISKINLDFEKSISFQNQHLILKNNPQFLKINYQFSKIATLDFEFFEIDPRSWSKSGVDFTKIGDRFPQTEVRYSKINYRLSLLGKNSKSSVNFHKIEGLISKLRINFKMED